MRTVLTVAGQKEIHLTEKAAKSEARGGRRVCGGWSVGREGSRSQERPSAVFVLKVNNWIRVWGVQKEGLSKDQQEVCL